VSLLLSMANLYYRDVKYLIEILITLWMFATSVVYPVTKVGGRLAPILALNPMTPIIDAYRSVLLHGAVPAMGPFACAAGFAVVLLAVSWVMFHRAEFQFAERI
jgi:ABC-type polysaccharide/polyol phosphate export permease